MKEIEDIVKEYTKYLNSIVNNMVQDNLSIEDKEEIVSDAFFIIWKKQEEVVNLKAYLSGITKNLVLEKLKKRKITYDISDFENDLEFTKNELFSVEREEIERIEDEIKNLNEVDIKILTDFYYSQKSVKEIANELNLTETNIKTRLHRIRKKIKKELKVGE